jgi:hypothetical protein
MAYHITVMTVDVYERFSRSTREKIGFLPHHRKAIQKLAAGDKLICYISGMMRWAGLLEVTSSAFEEDTSLFYPDNDLLTLRFQVKPLVWLSLEQTVPLKDERVWRYLSFTANTGENDTAWIGRLRTSLSHLDDTDGALMEKVLNDVQRTEEVFPYDEKLYRRHLRLSRSNYREKVAKDEDLQDDDNQALATPLRRSNRKRHPEKDQVEKSKKGRAVVVKRGAKPKSSKADLAEENAAAVIQQNFSAEKSAAETTTLTKAYSPTTTNPPPTSYTEDKLNHYIALAKIGVTMGMQIWAPLTIRTALKKHSELPAEYFLEHFPVFFDNTVNHYLEATPLIWVRGRMLLRAFSVFDNAENLYGSLIHYADLFVLQPNLLMKTHLVSSQKNKAILTDVVQRPLFAQMAGLPLQRRCQFLATETLQELLVDKHLSFLSDSVIDQ